MAGTKNGTVDVVSTGIPELDKSIESWLEWDKNDRNREEVISLCTSSKVEELKKLFADRLTFGTAGIRGRMGPGPTQMNDLVIIQTTQGLISYINQKTSKPEGIVVGYDGRHNSRRFAELAATIIVNSDIPVYLFSNVCPTPFVAYAVTHYHLTAGIMITASHNPKDDNGYKVYWSNGAQITSPHDKQIQAHILRNLEPWKLSWDTCKLSSSSLVTDPLEEVTATYCAALQETVLLPLVNSRSHLKFTYTAMHGVGYPFIARVFKLANLQPLIVVQQQRDPDPDFPTVKNPNPEEGKKSLDLSFQTADKAGSTIILANDPDADRLAVAEKNIQTKTWHVFTGNELGALLGWWSFYCFKQRCTSDLKDVYMLSSTVSSKIIRSMAREEGFNFIETLTGFKWMGNETVNLLAQGKHVLFAFEEAIGFMCGTTVLDKDGISAGLKVAELATYLESQGKTLSDQLAEIFEMYGFHLTENSYYYCYDQDTIKKLFHRLRNFDGEPNTYPSHILNGQYKIMGVRDLTTGYDSTQPDKKAILPISKSSEMITFTFTNCTVVTLRTSGTEPKIKYYTELCSLPGERDVPRMRSTLNEMVQGVVDEFLQPELNNLIPRAK